MEEAGDNDSAGERLADSQDGSSVDSNGSQTSDNQSDLSLSCSSSPFESHHSDMSGEEEPEGTVEPYLYEPSASSSGESVDSNDSEDLSRLNNTDWCECGNCQVMPTARECVCCCEIDQVNEKKQERFSGSEVTCIIDHEGFESVCLNVWVLQAAYFAYRYHYGEVGGLTHERYRFVAYRQLTGWCWGWLGRKVRVILPSCAVTKIRSTFPSDAYTGFKYPSTST